jgi:hypothetical protein
MRTLLFLASAATYAHAQSNDFLWPKKTDTSLGQVTNLANGGTYLGVYTSTFLLDNHFYVGDDMWLMHPDAWQPCGNYQIDGAVISDPADPTGDQLWTTNALHECLAAVAILDAQTSVSMNTVLATYVPSGWTNAGGCMVGSSDTGQSTLYWNPTTATEGGNSNTYRHMCKIVSDAPPPPECIHPDVPVHVLRGVSVETVKVGRLNVGDVVIGEGKTSAVKRVEHFSVNDEACVVPKDLCGGFDDKVVVSKSHAVRCQTWPTNTWTFCQPGWERVTTTEYVHVELESYLDDHLLSGSVVLESWDGYTRETDSIEDACSTRGCPWPHKWSSTDDNRWTRVDLRQTLFDSSPRLRVERT